MIEERLIPLETTWFGGDEPCMHCKETLIEKADILRNDLRVFELWEDNKFDYFCSLRCAEASLKARQLDKV
jgi:hypothetical protein